MDNKTTTQTYYGFILVMKGNGTVCGRFPMSKKECIFGRSKECDIRILLDNVSTQHCIIVYLDDKAYIRDKSMAGSTKVNGKKVGRNNFLLHHSDVIEIVGRKFIWKYTKSYVDCSLPGQESNYVTPKVSQRSSTIVAPLTFQNNKISHTPAKSSSTTLLSFKNTPIIVTKKNMTKSSFDKLKKSLKKSNSDANCEPEPQLTMSNSVMVGRNIPVISDSNIVQRKSWVIPNLTGNVSPTEIYNLNNLSRLSNDSLNIHPNQSTTNHYSDDEVEFDTSECGLLNNEYSVDTNTAALCSNNSSIENPSESIDTNVDNHSPFKNIQIANLSDSEPEPSTSRRDTYSIDREQIVVEQNTTPAPRRSILKCSKTARSIRSRSSGRMVQFARLPKSDSRIKISKYRFNLGSNIFDDKINDTDVFQDSKKVIKINSEEYDDDLDGVQPLDSSVSSLINSPILDNSSINKSSKRGSRGNKVLSLITSFEKRIFDSPKHSIRASDLLSMTGSKYEDSLSTTDFENNTTMLQESISSSRRINLENVFVTEDSLKNTCDLENETIISETDKSLIHEVETTLQSKQDLNNTDTRIISNNTPEDDLESEYNFAQPLILQLQNMYSTISETSPNHSTFVDPEKNQVNDEIEKSPLDHFKHLIKIENKEIHVGDVETPNSVIKRESKKKNIHDVEKSNAKENEHTQVENNIDDVETSNSVEKSKANENEHTQTENNIDDVEKSNAKGNEHTQVENNIDDVETSNSVEKSKAKENEHIQTENNINDIETSNSVKKSKAKENEHIQTENNINDVETSNSVEKSKAKENEHIETENNINDVETSNSVEKSKAKKNDISKLIEQVIEESPSISKIASCLSEMFNISKDDLETTNSQHQENITETYVIVEKDDQDKSNVNKDYKNNSNQFDKLIQSIKHSSTINNELENSNTVPSKKIVKVLNISTDSSDEMEGNENTDNVDTSLECTMSTLIGKPQYESTPWNFSSSLKTPSNTTLCTQQNEISVSKTKSKPQNNLVTFTSEPENWSQLMKDFNESVKKASISINNVANVSTINKVLFSEESESFKIASQVVSEDVLLNSKIIKNITSSNIDKNNTLQCSTITSCSPNTIRPESTNEHDRRSSRSGNNKPILQRKSPKVQNIKKMSITSESSIHDVISLSKNNSISTTITTANKSNKKSETKTVLLNNTNSNAMKKKLLVIPQKIRSDTESGEASGNEHDYNTDSDSLSSCVSNKPKPVKKKINVSPNVFTKRNLRSKVKKNESSKLTKKLTKKRTKNSSTSIKELCNNQQNSVIGEPKSAVKDSKRQTPIKPKKNVSFVENNIAKINLVIEKSEKIKLPPKRITRSNSTLTETSIPKFDKKNKIVSPINRTKSAQVGKVVQKKKPTKKALPKRVLPSKPVKTNTSYSSEYEESTNKEEESTPKICLPSKTKKEDKFTRKEKDNKVNNQDLLTNKRNQKEKNGETSSNISSYLSTRSRKRTADTPIAQPITKSPKINISSKVVVNSPQKYSLSEIKRTRNISNLTVNVSDNSSKTTCVNKIEKLKSTQTTNSRKRVLKSEVSSNDSEQSTRKKPRKATEKNVETKMKINSCTSSEKNKIQSTDTQEKLNKNEVKKSKSLIKPKKITRGAKPVVQEEFSSPRVLRVRDKKNK